jgi:hypothetical protein
MMVEEWEGFLPVEWDPSVPREGAYKWSNGLRCALERLSGGPDVSDVHTGRAFADFLSQVAHPDNNPDAAAGAQHYFHEVLESPESHSFFATTLPKMAALALRLPSLLLDQIEQTKDLAAGATIDHAGANLLPLQVSLNGQLFVDLGF